METVKCYVENERLVVEFEGKSRFVYIEGQTEDGVFRIRSEHFEKIKAFLMQTEGLFVMQLGIKI